MVSKLFLVKSLRLQSQTKAIALLPYRRVCGMFSLRKIRQGLNDERGDRH